MDSQPLTSMEIVVEAVVAEAEAMDPQIRTLALYQMVLMLLHQTWITLALLLDMVACDLMECS